MCLESSSSKTQHNEMNQPDDMVMVTVQLGDPVTLSCAFSERLQNTAWLHWYKQSAGDTLKFIVLQQKSIKPNFERNVSTSRIAATNDDKVSKLTIRKTVLQDEGMYHCAHMDWTVSTWTGTYLSVKANSRRTSSYTVLQNPVSDPARPTDSETLQCSVISESENKACSGEPSVFWFRSGSEQSYPEIIHSTDKGLRDCENTTTSNTLKKCSYSFYKNVSSSDTGTFYCAVATCGEILFGNGIKTADQSASPKVNVLMIIIICLAISTVNGQDLNYAALHFDGKKTSRGKIKQLKTEDSVYSQVKCDEIRK
uniref:Ig-like domain-containing protein n=1 Tax=Poecilia mexicana TaxID=48701 RepID=A0A3B3WKB1_9TELE